MSFWSARAGGAPLLNSTVAEGPGPRPARKGLRAMGHVAFQDQGPAEFRLGNPSRGSTPSRNDRAGLRVGEALRGHCRKRNMAQPPMLCDFDPGMTLSRPLVTE